MALKVTSPFSIFAPKSPSHPRPITEIRFSRWNNANAQKFVLRQRAQKEIEDEIRRERRYQSATNITEDYDRAIASENPVPEFKSQGTPSSPSLPSIPGKSSKYSKSPQNPRSRQNPRNPNSSHPAFRRILRVSKVSAEETVLENGISVGDNGIAYRVPNAPFEFQYSYTETPKVKPLALREPPFVPFGPSTMPRPWTGRAPLPASKKKLPDFDSFRLPPPHKKGVKPVQAPGPFLAGSGPKYVMSREEILGEPLTAEEIKDLIRGCLKIRRQLNMGRDGLTHNMLDNIHAHWKRRRVCKIKCKGVCTVDMDNVHQQLEEKTGGKIIYSRGGVLFLYRGRNYNYRTRPKFPLMLWKPITPVYPRLVQLVPEGLKLEEAIEMRKRGRKLPPICKLGKNGVYSDLTKNVREAFEECELVRINCQGMNKSDYKKIGGKLKDLVPCVLVSFEHEHILMWRGRDWKSSLPIPEDECNEAAESTIDSGSANSLNVADSCLVSHETSELGIGKSSDADEYPERHNHTVSTDKDVGLEQTKDIFRLEKNNQQQVTTHLCHSAVDVNGSATTCNSTRSTGESTAMLADPKMVSCNGLAVASEDRQGFDAPLPSMLVGLETTTDNRLAAALEDLQGLDQPTPSTESSVSQSSTGSSQACTEGVLLLLKQAIESGSALVFDDDSLDANIIFERAVALAKTAHPGPVFKHRFSKVLVQKSEKKESSEDLQVEEVMAFSKRGSDKKTSKNQRKDLKYEYPGVIPQGSLAIDELAKLLA